MKKFFLLSITLSCITFLGTGCRTNPHRQARSKPIIQSATMKVDFRIGDTNVSAVTHQKLCNTPTMINVHDDENTSVEAGKINLNQYGGRLIELVHSGERLVTFKLDGKQYSFDPNRVFSDVGIVATLKKHSSYSEAAHKEIKSFATAYLKHFTLDKEPVIIALHNTVDGTFSVESFVPGASLASDAAAAYASPNRNKFDFFYVTDKKFYDYLKARDFNVVLQDNDRVTEDGSLSVYFSRKGIPYINIEAEIHNLNNQIEMVKVTHEMLKDLGYK
ncbi:MAG: hypothetical protein JWQ71_4671 [Pedosphaera sp.]|nr:hypothetical protein [Pedosphaera sp.]